MNNFGGLFAKYRKIIDASTREKTIISETLSTIVGQKINTDDFSIKKGVLKLKTSASIRALVFINKGKILKTLAEAIPETKINDVN